MLTAYNMQETVLVVYVSGMDKSLCTTTFTSRSDVCSHILGCFTPPCVKNMTEQMLLEPLRMSTSCCKRSLSTQTPCNADQQAVL